MPAKSHDELTLFDLADWLWSYRFLALIFALVAVVWSAFSFLGSAPVTERPVIEVRLFSAGTPVRGEAEILAMANSVAAQPGAKLLSPLGERALRIEVATEEAAVILEDRLDALEKFLVAEVSRQIGETEGKLQTNAAALALYLRAKSFDDAIREGYIDPILVLRDTQGQPKQVSALPRLLLPAVASFGGFWTIALFATFWREWRKHRREAKKMVE